MTSILSSLILVLLSAQYVETNEPTALTQSYFAIGTDPLDHATVAMNDAGDVFITWQGEDISSGNFFVEGLYIPRNGGNDEWSMPTSQDDDYHILLGDPNQDPLSLSVSTNCKKPDVVAVGDNFIVVWSRQSVGYPGFDRLESAFIEISGDKIDEINGDVPSNYDGVGDTVANYLDQGNSGLMPDLVTLGTDHAAVVFVNHTDLWGTEDQFRDFEICVADLDYSGGSLSLDLQLGLVVDQPLDNLDSSTIHEGNEMVGGNIAPDVITESGGDIVFAFSTYEGERVGTTAGGTGLIWLCRAEYTSSNWSVTDSAYFEHTNPSSTDPTRRPNLARSELDNTNEVILTWIDTQGTFGTTPYRIRTMIADFDSNPVDIDDTYDLHSVSTEDGQCVPLNLADGLGEDSIFFDRDVSGDRDIYRSIVNNVSYSEEAVLTNWRNHHWRPALATLEASGSGNNLVVITWEGDNTPNPVYEIHFAITRM